MTTADEIAAAIAPIAGRRAARPRISGNLASLIVDATGLNPPETEALERELTRVVGAMPGIATVRIAFTSERATRRLIAVASGKGGVGKSTLAANLAVALAGRGLPVGLVDADIYGPSLPRLMKAEGVRPTAREKQLIPVVTDLGVPMLSMGQLVAPGQAVAWRGPMIGSALGQLLDADWGATDTLVVDLPPGTGDIQLTMVQKYRPVGAVIVSTPQDLALIDARRAIDLFAKVKVPIIGLVENMAGYACPHCGGVSHPFGSGGAEAEAERLGVPFLGRIPLDAAIRTASDAGDPPASHDNAGGAAFRAVADRLHEWLNAPH
ncbi:Mrp/NBP35 family ATP-binding protein [Sphingomonas flavalba]|uniref:Mrp/NBP35 family ATP-binding protein n=1 Tax=Sphingomonas flavalba TaxID=2559804 RepID=UPI00109DDAD2|nr:Mrp/NBP35 family ATP-binding protein [Sphingomonas flavalba]